MNQQQQPADPTIWATPTGHAGMPAFPQQPDNHQHESSSYQPAPRAITNGFAVASLVLGLLGGVLLSVIFGFVALSQIKRTGQRGRGQALGGLIASAAWVLLIGGAITVGAIVGPRDTDEAGSNSVALSDLTAGTCVNGLEEGEQLLRLPTVPCTEPHQGEVYAVFDMADGPWPGTGKVYLEANEQCHERLVGYIADPDPNFDVLYFSPERSTWGSDKSITCIALFPGGPRAGLLRN